MTIIVYGGTFNPPHIGHIAALQSAAKQLCADKTIIIPTAEPPHKQMSGGNVSSSDRLQMTKLAFEGVSDAQVSDIEILRGGKSYTADTIRALMDEFPGADFVLLMGTDMIASFTKWREFEWLLGNVTLAVFPRNNGDEDIINICAEQLIRNYDANILGISLQPVEISSSKVRDALPLRGGREFLTDAVYAYIIKNRLYGAKPEFEWLREKAYAMLKPNRVAHVRGCEEEAVRLAQRYGECVEDAAEAAILHDITKKLDLDEQREVCAKYHAEVDEDERNNVKLLHSKTGAAVARAEFGVSDRVYEAIRWHTTGKANMSLLEKIIYMADYIEPNRNFPGVEQLRKATYDDIDVGMRMGLEMSLNDLRSYNVVPHKNTLEAFDYLKKE